MKSFDEYNAREQQLVQFNKWANHEGLSLRMSGEFDHSNKDTHMAYLGYVEGQQSKQAEVDELRKNLNNALKTIEIQQRFLDDADGANKILTSQASDMQKMVDELEGKNKILGMRLDVIQGVMQKEIDSIIKMKGDQS